MLDLVASHARLDPAKARLAVLGGILRLVAEVLLRRLPGYGPGGAARKAELTLAEMTAELERFLVGEYHNEIHTTTGFKPQERWTSGGFLPRMPRSLEQLDLLLMTVAKTRRVHPDGIRFSGLRYIDATLAAYVGEEVLLRYDPRDVAEVRVFHGGRFVCRAACQELAGETVPLREVIRSRERRRRGLRRTIEGRRKAVESLLEVRRGGVGEPPAPIDICRMMKRRLKAAGLPGHLSPHSSRVTTVTDLLEQNVPPEDVQYLAGHADPRTTRVYDRKRRKVTRDIVERISI